MVEIIDYNIYTTPFKDLPCLEDAIQKGYNTEDEQNRTVNVSIREYPAALSYAIDSLIKQGNSNYFSVIERHAVYYALSVLKSDVEEIVKKRREVQETGELHDLELMYNSSTGLPFRTMTRKERSHVYMPWWCEEWIQSNSRHLNMPSGRLSVYLVIWALNKSTIINPAIKKEIQTEANWFIKYVEMLKQR